MLPVARSERERRRMRELLHSDRPGVLLQLPLAVFDYVYYNRYDVPVGREPEAGPLDEAAIRRKIGEDPAFRADAELFNKRFAQFQQLMHYLFTMHLLRRKDRMQRFDLFDVEAYDAVLERIAEERGEGSLPPVSWTL